jgi:hypothetical protein
MGQDYRKSRLEAGKRTLTVNLKVMEIIAQRVGQPDNRARRCPASSSGATTASRMPRQTLPRSWRAY